jgi:peptidoglycan/LPS O-acetylase OafA/YrhL
MEIKPLTGIRGIAALIVLWHHMEQALISRGLPLEFPLLVHRLILNGTHSVDVFFVLSGFILALTYQKWFAEALSWSSYSKFFRRRIARIYPLHFAVLTLTVLAVIAARLLHVKTYLGLDRFDFGTLPEHYLLIHAWGITFHGTGDWNPPSWSISIEMLAYLLLPPILFVLARFKQSQSWLLLGAAIAIGFGLNYLMAWDVWGPAGISRGCSEFLLGCITARFVNAPVATWLRTQTGSLLSAAALLVACGSISDTGFIIGLCTAPLILALCDKNLLSRFFAWRPVYFLGEISYSIYIGHTLFLLLIWRVIKPEWMAQGAWQLAAGFVAVNFLVVAMSAVTFYMIEQPGRNWLSDKKRSTPALASNEA